MPLSGSLFLNLERNPGVPLLNFEEVPGVSVLNLRGASGSTFKLGWGSRVPGSWSHFYTMPIKLGQRYVE